MLDVTFFGLSDEALEIVPSHTQNFQEWVDSLSEEEFEKYSNLCNKPENTSNENRLLLNTALAIFFKENDIDEMPYIEEVVSDLLGAFKRNIIQIGLFRSGYLFMEGPVLLKNEIIPSLRIKAYCV